MRNLAWNKSPDVNTADKITTVNSAVAKFVQSLTTSSGIRCLGNSMSAFTFYSLFLPTFLPLCLSSFLPPLVPPFCSLSLLFSLLHSFLPSSITKYFLCFYAEHWFTSKSYTYILSLLLLVLLLFILTENIKV